MQLDRIGIALRARSAYEAMDLGFALARTHAKAIWLPWVLLTLPVFVLFNAIAYWLGKDWIGWLGFWWFKPWFDRIPLFVLSRSVFGMVPDWRTTLRQHLKLGAKEIWHFLTWRRLSPNRAAILPVHCLEGLPSKDRGERTRVVLGSITGPSLMLTTVCLLFVFVLVFSFISLVWMFVPVEKMADWGESFFGLVFENTPTWFWLLRNALFALATMIIEPLYIAAGFGLYLNRRTQLEAWDVELAFRSLVRRLTSASVALVFALTLILGMNIDAHAKPVVATEKPSAGLNERYGNLPLAARADFAKATKAAHEDPAFGRKYQVKEWVLRDPGDKKKPKSSDNTDLRGLIEGIEAVVSFISAYGLWVIAGTLLIWALLKINTWMPWVQDAIGIVRETRAREVYDPANDETPLPADPLASMRALWAQGERRAAMALLYRVALARLVHQLDSALPPGTTEAEALRRSRNLADAGFTQWFARVVRQWQALAYAHREPDESEWQALLAQASSAQVPTNTNPAEQAA